MVYLDIKFYFHEKFLESAWTTFLALVTLTLVIALLSLLPLWRSETYRKATNSIVLLALLNFVCYGSFGAFILAQTLICGDPYLNPSLDLLRFFCNIETFYSVIFIFPTVYSLGNVVVISRGEMSREVLGEWAQCIRSLTGRVVLGCRFGERDRDGDRRRLQPGATSINTDLSHSPETDSTGVGLNLENRCNSEV